MLEFSLVYGFTLDVEELEKIIDGPVYPAMDEPTTPGWYVLVDEGGLVSPIIHEEGRFAVGLTVTSRWKDETGLTELAPEEVQVLRMDNATRRKLWVASVRSRVKEVSHDRGWLAAEVATAYAALDDLLSAANLAKWAWFTLMSHYEEE